MTFRRYCLGALTLATVAGACSSGTQTNPVTGGGGTGTTTSTGGTGGWRLAPGETDPRAIGKADLSGITFTAFSQTGNQQNDSQVLDLVPDLVPRAWARWDVLGLKPADYDFTYPAACKAKGITFVAGTTASVIFKDEVTPDEFLDQVTRDAAGNPVPHSGIVPNAYRATLASPAYRQRLIDIAKVQIDGGVDGLFFDEVLGGYAGANWTGGNEGFDDHQIADFGAYLCNKYSASPAKLTGDLGVTPADKLDCTEASAGRTFNYRGYLARHGAETAPLGSLNPLAPDWGTTVNNRPDPAKGTFLETYPTLVYWQEVVVAVRTYAREKYNREVLITSNGVFPYVDFQGVGLYDWNIEGTGPRGFDWVPVKGGNPTCYEATAGCELNGTPSFVPALKNLKARSKRIMEATKGPEVPVLLFLDWPTDTMNRYYALPLQQRQDYFRLFVAEASALGVWYSIPLATTTDAKTATALAMMDFFKHLRGFYKDHADLYHGALESTGVPTVSAPSTATVLTTLPDGRTVLHVINHSYVGGVVGQKDVTATFPRATAPTTVTLVSPDFTADKTALFTYQDGVVTVTVGDLDASVAVVAR